MAPEVKGRTGRRAGGTNSRELLLEAARAQFASGGYDGATVRGIASDAGVDPALIRHFFGGKDGLFAATLQLPAGVQEAMLEEFRRGPGGLAERVTRRYLALWEEESSRLVLLGIVRTALTDDRAMARFRDAIITTVVRQGASHIRGDQAELRLSLAMGSLIGAALTRHVVRAPSAAAVGFEELVAAVAPGVHRYLFEDLAR